jgi:hypothetical protein
VYGPFEVGVRKPFDAGAPNDEVRCRCRWRRHIAPPGGDSMSETPPDEIASRRVADRSTHSVANTTLPNAIYDRNRPPPRPTAWFVYEFSQCTSARARYLAHSLYSDAPPPFAPARRDYSPTGFGAHTPPEAVLLVAAAVVRLVRPFHAASRLVKVSGSGYQPPFVG